MTIKVITKKFLEEASTFHRIVKIAGQHFSIEQNPAGYLFVPLTNLVRGTPSADREYIRINGISFLEYSHITISATSAYLKDAEKLAKLIQEANCTVDITVFEK